MTVGGPSTAADRLFQRLFGSPQFGRLWISQIFSATGDWLAFVAIISVAARVGGGTPEASVGFVIIARILPGFFLGQAAGVLADRWDRRRTMVVCDLGRAATLIWVPFVDFVWQLVIISLVLEGFTLLWAPAKEASVPNLVPQSKLATANSFSVAAGYGTFPVAAGLALLFGELASHLHGVDALRFLRIDDGESLAFYADALTFVTSAVIVSRLVLPRPTSVASGETRFDLGTAFRELLDGWNHMFLNPTVRGVNAALATGLIGGGMLIPLGPKFSDEVIGAGDSGFETFILALGMGVAVSVAVLAAAQQKMPKQQVFLAAVFGAGIMLFAAASMWTLILSALFVSCLGVCAGAVYIFGYTLLQESVADELRGRIFAGLNTLVRLSVFLAIAVGPFLALALNGLSDKFFDKNIEILGFELFIPGVRLTLWLAALIIIGAGVLARASLRQASRS